LNSGGLPVRSRNCAPGVPACGSMTLPIFRDANPGFRRSGVSAGQRRFDGCRVAGDRAASCLGNRDALNVNFGGNDGVHAGAYRDYRAITASSKSAMIIGLTARPAVSL
jgi:hypothetical protein